jgi:acetyltransferase-like isoleucine patch superfamily enzyme
LEPVTHTSGSPDVRIRWGPATTLRVVWAIVSALLVEMIVLALAVLPAAQFWLLFLDRDYPLRLMSIVVLAMGLVPSYLIFAFALIVLSALSMRLVGWRTPRDAELRIADLDWPLLDWGRYMASVHVVRLLAGAVFRATPLWTFYLRLNGATLGRGVYINSLKLNDHNLLEFGDAVLIGDDVHLSGHTVERGVLRTAGVRLGRGVNIGLGAVIGIGVEAGPGCQIGALSLVPKFTTLEAEGTYVGTPVRRLDRDGKKGPGPFLRS